MGVYGRRKKGERNMGGRREEGGRGGVWVGGGSKEGEYGWEDGVRKGGMGGRRE